MRYSVAGRAILAPASAFSSMFELVRLCLKGLHRLCLRFVRHRHVLEDIPKPSELCRVSGRNGGQFNRYVGPLWRRRGNFTFNMK
jgi:hypothetical protein